MRIVVTGASGHYGRRLTELLLARVRPPDLILVTRRPERLQAAADRGVEVRYGDFDRPERLPEAFKGGERLLLISTLAVGPRRRRQHQAAIEAAATAGVRHIAYTSSTGIHPRSPSLAVQDHVLTEDAIRRSGLAFTFLRDAQYAEVIATMLAPLAVASGKWSMSTGSGCMAFVSKQDCVASAAAVLTSDGHEGAVYEITGPQLYTFADAAALAAEISGRSIAYSDISHEERLAEFDALGVPREYVEGMLNADETGVWGSEEMVSYERAIRQGYFSVCSHHVELLTGRPAKSLREVFLENRDALLGAARA
ncbi:MAG TPA: NAD(P)H-binding protein [Steroidobacteraceae bacterium]|nr:NAD(P)H-binding protein [Steroidobacteraceae bacterium]